MTSQELEALERRLRDLESTERQLMALLHDYGQGILEVVELSKTDRELYASVSRAARDFKKLLGSLEGASFLRRVRRKLVSVSYRIKEQERNERGKRARQEDTLLDHASSAERSFKEALERFLRS